MSTASCTSSCTTTGISGLFDDSQNDSQNSCFEQEKPVDSDIEKCTVMEDNSDSTSVRFTVIESRSGESAGQENEVIDNRKSHSRVPKR